MRGMVKVPADCYLMGKNKLHRSRIKRYADYEPAHRVCLDAFLIDKTEVTVKQYARCVRAKACTEPLAKDPNNHMLSGCNWKAKGHGHHPVNCVDWNQAAAYCKWRHKRLPTEAEWEYAARGTDSRPFPWGRSPGGSICGFAVYKDRWGHTGCGQHGTYPVGTHKPGASPFGALDMAGNVFEWVQDCYDPHAYRQTKSGTKNPGHFCSGPAKRVIRGGGWLSSEGGITTYLRNKVLPNLRTAAIGFRCVKSLTVRPKSRR